MSKSYTPTTNALVWIEILIKQFVNEINNKFRDKILGKEKEQIFKPIQKIDTLEKFKDITNKITSKEIQVPENYENEEISISYVSMKKILNCKEKVVNKTFIL